jgi:hypothetical protein
MTLTVQAPNAPEEAENAAIVTSATPDPNPADASAAVIVNVTTPAFPPFLGYATTGPGGFHLTVSNSQSPVVIQASTNLINWVNIYTNTGTFNFTDSVAPGYPKRFYRAFEQ